MKNKKLRTPFNRLKRKGQQSKPKRELNIEINEIRSKKYIFNITQ